MHCGRGRHCRLNAVFGGSEVAWHGRNLKVNDVQLSAPAGARTAKLRGALQREARRIKRNDRQLECVYRQASNKEGVISGPCLLLNALNG